MDIWNDYVLPELAKLAQQDENYQRMLMENQKLETSYCDVIDSLSDSDREMIDEYIASCENLEYRLTQLAYELGCGRSASDK